MSPPFLLAIWSDQAARPRSAARSIPTTLSPRSN